MLKNTRTQRGVRRLACLQVLLVAVLTVIFYVLGDSRAAYSSLLGGLIAAIPTQYFAHRLFRYQGAQAARQIVQSFYIGEAIKWLLTALMFVIVFALINISAPALFISFIVVQILYWVTPLIF